MPSLSVVVCTHNPRADYLRQVLGSLERQSLPKSRWELLLIDNASDQKLSDLFDLSWHPCARHVREDALGLTVARFRGISESRGELLVFVDDDNVLAPDFLSEALAILGRYPFLGVVGVGSQEQVFEVSPAPEIQSRVGLLGVRTVASEQWGNNPMDFATIPWGAGLCVKRRVADLYQPFVERLGIHAMLGRKGAQLFSSEDNVFSWVASSIGLGFGVFPQLRITHLIPARRLSRAYILQLSHDHAFSGSVLHFLLAGRQPRRMDAFRYVHLLLHALRNGYFSMKCQWAESRAQDSAARFILAERLGPLGQSSVCDAAEFAKLETP